MRGVGFFTWGGPEVLQVIDLPEAHVGAGQVRIRNHAATVNPTDLSARNGSRQEQQKADPPPYVPGMEVGGVVDEIGLGVTGLKVGDAVLAIVVPKGSHGAYREQLTARQALDRLGLKPGQVIAVTGAAGAFGGYVVQLAKTEGLTVIADASEKDEALVKSLGADIVLPRGDDIAQRIRQHFPHGVDGLADGAVLKEKVIPAVKDGGAFTSVRGFQGVPARDIRFSMVSVSGYVFEHDKLDRLRQLVDEGKLTLRVAATYKPEQAAEAHRRLEAGGTRGRISIGF
jgi:NADPH:quinone reductase